MDANTAKGLIGQEVTLTKDNVLADITAYEKGWFTVMPDDGIERKVRAKGLILMDSDEEIVEKDGEVSVNPIAEDGEISSENASAPIEVGSEMGCDCGHVFPIPKLECFKCPKCGAWHKVRLHPDMDKYIIGMGETPSGRSTVDIDDEVATNLRGMNLDELYNYVCNQLDTLDEKARFSKAMTASFKKSAIGCAMFLEERYADLNPGMQRMNLGNLLRGAIKRDAEIRLVEEVKKDA